MDRENRKFLIKVGVIVGSGGFLFGYDIGVIANTIGTLNDQFHLNGIEEGAIVAAIYAGAIFGSLFGGQLCDYFGRWKTIHIQNIIFIIGAIITGGAIDIGTLFVGRFIVGIASAISGIADIPYLQEIAPARYRGLLSGQYEILVGVGVLIAFAVGFILSPYSYGWRIAFILPSGGAVLQSIGMLYLPESPKWLLEKGKVEEAKAALLIIYGRTDLVNSISDNSYRNSDDDSSRKSELREFHNVLLAFASPDPITGIAPVPILTIDENNKIVEVDEEETKKAAINDTNVGKNSNTELSQMSKKSSGKISSGRAEVHEKSFKEEIGVIQDYNYSIFIIVMIQILSQITGGVVIRNYAATIFEDGGVSTGAALGYNVILGVVKLVFTIVSVLYIEKTGRRSLLLYGIVIVGIGMLFLFLVSVGVQATHSDAGNYVGVYIVGCALTLGGYGIGYGPGK